MNYAVSTVTSFLFVAILWGGAATASQGRATSDVDVLRAVADAHDENRAKFPFGSIESRFLDGYAANVDEAASGKITDLHEAQCSYLFDGVYGLHVQKFSTASMTATTTWSSPGSSAGRLNSFRHLTNGKLTLVESITSMPDGEGEYTGSVINPGTASFYRGAVFPLSLGHPDANRMDMSYWIRAALAHSNGASLDSVDSEAVSDGKKVVRITIKLEKGKVSYWADLERGAIPIRTHVYDDDKVIYGEINGAIKHVAGHGWLPFEQTAVFAGTRVRRIIIDRASFDKPPSRSVFKLELAYPRSMGNLGANVAYINPQKIWDLDHLPSSPSEGVTPLVKRTTSSQHIAALPGEREPRPRYFTIGSIALAVLVGAFFAIRRVWRRGG